MAALSSLSSATATATAGATAASGGISAQIDTSLVGSLNANEKQNVATLLNSLGQGQNVDAKA